MRAKPPFSSQSMSCRHPVECRNAKTSSYLGRPFSLKLVCLLEIILRETITTATSCGPPAVIQPGGSSADERILPSGKRTERERKEEKRKEGDKTRKEGQFGSAMTGIGISRSLARLRLCRAFMTECGLRPAQALPRPYHPSLNTVQING